MPRKLTIAERRLDHGLTQKRLGDLAGLDQPTVSRAEQGQCIPEVVQRLTAALDQLDAERVRQRMNAASFWDNGDLQQRDMVIATVRGVAVELLLGALADQELGKRLLDVLPPEPAEQRRKRAA